jgi:hypothetical protein
MRKRRLLPLLLLLAVQPSLVADTVIDFEGFADGTLLSNLQYPGLTFINAIVLTAGISLDEFEFPPRSGVNVASDFGGPMSIDFASPVLGFGGYFTYAGVLTLQGFDASNSQVASVTSAFSNNEAISGIPGSSPNEFLHVSFPNGISSVTITGNLAGDSFTLDDATIQTSSTVIPEPSAAPLLLTVIVILAVLRDERVRG